MRIPENWEFTIGWKILIILQYNLALLLPFPNSRSHNSLLSVSVSSYVLRVFFNPLSCTQLQKPLMFAKTLCPVSLSNTEHLNFPDLPDKIQSWRSRDFPALWQLKIQVLRHSHPLLLQACTYCCTMRGKSGILWIWKGASLVHKRRWISLLLNSSRLLKQVSDTQS